MNSFTILWESVLKKLEAFYSQNNNSFGFATYVRVLSPEYEENGVFFFKVPNEYYKEQIQERFLWKIAETLKESIFAETGKNRPIDVRVLTPKELDEQLMLSKSVYTPLGNNTMISLNPNYTFDTFVVGSSNNLAHAASLAVANAPGFAYNPLFIYGGVGLGKTHLMHAIGNRILEGNPGAKIIYITSESFTNEFIESIQRNSQEAFRAKFRTADVLMIDDIQFIAKAQRTQEELFHTFNTLYESDKQIIFSSDKPPSEIPKLEERLLSRFNSGLLTDIRLPDYETRVAILKNKVPMIKEKIRCNLDIEEEVLHYIASKEDSNIRDLEGALKKVIASAQLENSLSSINMEIARRALKDFFVEPVVKTITPKLVVRCVCEYYDISEDDIYSKKKNREIAFPRQVVMYLLKHLTDFTNKKICECVGLKDHSTAIYAYDKVASLIKTDAEVQSAVNDIISKIKE